MVLQCDKFNIIIYDNSFNKTLHQYPDDLILIRYSILPWDELFGILLMLFGL